MRNILRSSILSVAIVVLLSTVVGAGGLSSTFVEVKLKDVEPGKLYSIKEKLGKALIITNTTETLTVDIKIEPEKPVDYNLVPGYEPLPDLSWVIVENPYFKDIGPGKSAETDILIQVPDSREYRGKKYQVYIYSHTAGKGTFRVGLMGRILIEMIP